MQESCQKDETLKVKQSETETERDCSTKKIKEGPSNDKLSEGTSQYADTWRDLHVILIAPALLPSRAFSQAVGAAFGFEFDVSRGRGC